MSSFFKKKCPACQVKTPKEKLTHELRINTSDGILSMMVCESCSRFWDGTTTIMENRKPKRGVTDDNT